MMRRNQFLLGLLLLLGSSGPSWAADGFEQSVLPVLRQHCTTCHSTKEQAGELDLERFSTVELVKADALIWEHVREQLVIGEMPPKDSPQLTVEQKQLLMEWVTRTLSEVALENAGDPGPVVLRRLSNHEYEYSLRDLTGISTLEPARELPVDGAAGEGFTNVGAALVMSPGLLRKYLDAAKDVAAHAVLLPDGIRFSASDSRQDWTDECLEAIRDFYRRHSTATEIVSTVDGTGRVATEAGAIPVQRYFDALQGRTVADGLNPQYLQLLREKLTAGDATSLIREAQVQLSRGELNAAFVERWQKVLWRFGSIGHIGRINGPKSWMQAVSPLVSQRELRIPLDGSRANTVYLVGGTAGDGDTGDQILWEHPRLVAKGRPDLPATSIPQLVEHLSAERARLLASVEPCLAALWAEASAEARSSTTSDATELVDAEALAAWKEYLGFSDTPLGPLMTSRLERTMEFDFVQGWLGDNALGVQANSSDALVRVPGVMEPHSVATHPAPDRAAVIAWRSPAAMTIQVTGNIKHAHSECGNGITWAVEVRRGATAEALASGVSNGAQEVPFGPFADIHVDEGNVVALIVGPRDGNHSCDLTRINLHLSSGETTWDLARDVSPNILAGNPHGVWHFLSQPASQPTAAEVPHAMAEWRKAPSAERAQAVREALAANFPLTHPLLNRAVRSFRPADGTLPHIVATAPGVTSISIPAELCTGAEFVTTARLVQAGEGSVQAEVSLEEPQQPLTTAVPEMPVIVGDGSAARERFEAAFEDFRALFPATLCYTKIVPVDEVVTLTLYYREDEHLQRLMLNDTEAKELDRLWDELRFVSQAPVRQVDAFEQIYQFATQDRPDLVNEFEPLREPILRAAKEFEERLKAAEAPQREAVIALAGRAWRRPLTETEAAELRQFPPRLGVARVLTSPAFLYRSEQVPGQTGPVSDWELATRLSYFLWSSLPDDELRAAAAAGTLHQPEVLAAQARRMLKDERVRRLATEFGCQAIHVRDVATLDEKSERHFPTFAGVRGDLQEEVTLFFVDLFQENRDVLALVDADYTFLNKNLADHYGLPFEGTGWARVEGVRERGRGGILGFGATLAKHSGASRTSAILRGTWVSEVVLGDKLPNPPKGVPVLPEEAPEGLSERQLIERHSSDPRCAGCHKRIDPFGFALEGFDAIGRLRTADTATTLSDGTDINGIEGLRSYLLVQRRDDVLRQFCRKLLGYALGRSVQLSDQPLIDEMVAAESHRAGDLVERIVLSRQFQEIRGREGGVASR